MGPKAKGWERHMMKRAIELNDSIELCHRQITNSGREIVGLKIVDSEAA